MKKQTRLRRLIKWGVFPPLGLVALLVCFYLLFPSTVQSWLATGTARLLPHFLAWRSGTGPFVGGLTVTEAVPVPMRDGVNLSTDLYLPDGPGPFPVIVIRTPYTKQEVRPVGDFFARYGYAVAAQDVRGRHKSEGEFYPFKNEQADGADTTRWIKSQAWCNGKIGAFGGSYLGFTQWAMAAGNPDVTSISPTFITANLYNGIYHDGAFGKLTFLHWTLTSEGRYGDLRAAAKIKTGYSHFPLRESDDAARHNIPFFDDWVDHSVPDDYWRGMSTDHRFSEMTAPVFMTSGWYDFFRDAQIEDFLLLRKTATSRVRDNTKMLLGPWSHSFFNANHPNYGVRPGRLEVIPFEFVRMAKEWLDYSLKGVDNGWERRPPLRVYILGKNIWMEEREWPPARAVPHSFYLHSGGDSRTLKGDGRLDLNPPVGAEPEDSFVYDPRDPVPTSGGNHGDPWFCGPVDQRKVEERPDVLVFSTDPLEKPLLVMGRLTARIYASSTAPDTDFTAKVVDVFPDGQALIVCEGIVRARYRNGLDRPELMEPGRPYSFEIRIGHTAVSFAEGHRIRLEISSSNSPRYDANPNTGNDIGTERNPVPATQRIFHTSAFPSALILPVVAGQ